MGTLSLIVTLLITSAASLEEKCSSNILKKFMSDPSKTKAEYGYGETISVTCLAGSGDSVYDYYSSDNSDNSVILTCTDGKWIGHYPECFTNCSRPDIFAVLDPEYDLYAPGDIVTVQACKKDNAPIEGKTTFTCMADGTWTGSARCPKQQKSCIEQPPSIANAYVAGEVQAEYRHGTILQYKCSQAFDQTGRQSATCQEGRWIQDTSKLTLCTIGQCSTIYNREIDNGHVKNIVGEVGTYAEFECYDGYELEGSARILCMADRKWNPEIPRCKPISCPAPKQPSHGRLAQEAYNGVLNIYQSTIRYDCDKGYRLVGPQFRKCQADRTWSGKDTKCEEIVCVKPSSPENGKVYLTDNSEKVGSQIEYICDEDHIMEPINSQFAICTEQGYWSRPEPRCIKSCKVSIIANGTLKRNIWRGETITKETYVPTNTQLIFSCMSRFEMYAGGYVTEGRLNCADGSLLPGIPECRPQRCWIEQSVNLEYFIGEQKVSDSYIDSETQLQARCPNRMELFRLDVYVDSEQISVKCSMGTLEPRSLDCKDKRCNIINVENGQFKNRGKEISSGGRIDSRDNIRLICSDGYELYNEWTYKYLEAERIDIQCFQGSFTARIPTCKPKRCKVDSTRGRLPKFSTYSEHGVNLSVNCSDEMELFGAGQYLDKEKILVSCNKGTWIPDLPECVNKRCILPTIDNGRSRKGTTILQPGEKIASGEKAQLECFEGYELFNGTYIDSDRTDIECNEGSFIENIPSCKDKRCQLNRLSNLLPQISFTESGSSLNVSCLDNMEMIDTGVSQNREVAENGESVNKQKLHVFCNKGTWRPDLPHCSNKNCTLPDVGGEITGFIVSGTEIKPEEFVPHDQSIYTVCREGYRQQGFLTCNGGNWTGDSTCQLEVCDKPAFEYIILNQGILANDEQGFSHGTKLTASCKSSSNLYIDDVRPKRKENTTTECIHGEWKPKFSCKKKCTLPHGTFNFANPMYKEKDKKEGDRIHHGRFVVRACPPKYEESRSSKCSDGIWDPPFTDCAKDIVRCQIFNNTGMHFTSLRNDTVGVGGDFEKGDKILVSCTSGYKTTIFAEPEYDYDNNDTEVTADPVGAPESRGSQKPSPVSNGTYTCGDSGDWEPKIRFTCEKIVCDPLDDNRFENGKILYSSHKYTVGTKASFVCDPDYNITGSEFRVCQEDGTWSNACVTCQNNKRNASKTCLAPCVPDGAKKTGSYTYEVGSRVEFQCLPSNTQYSGDSSNSRQCIQTERSASWTGTHINCKGVGDVLLRTIAGELEGEWENLSRALGLQYEQLIVAPDEPSRNALKILQYWRDSAMRNKPRSLIPQLIVALEKLQKRNAAEVLRGLNGLQNVRCMRPGLNGTITPNKSEYQFGESVKVSSCNDGYILVNQGYLVCSENKTWFGNSTCRNAVCNPDCGRNKRCVRDNECQCAEWFSGKTCDQEVISEGECEALADPYKVIQTGVVPGKLSHNTVVMIQCNVSQAPFDDLVKAECKNGVWFQWKPTCQNTCTLPSFPGAQYNYNISRTTVLPDLISSGRRIKVTCESGYFQGLERSDVSICENGVWKPELSSCEKIASCATPNISDVIVQPSKKSYAVNETVSLTGCQKGLGLVGAKSLLCGTDGLWSGHAQCISYCQYGRTDWNSTSYKRVIRNRIKEINYSTYQKESLCFETCAKNPSCKAVYIYQLTTKVNCMVLAENTSENPEAFISQGLSNEKVYDRTCDDACVVRKDLAEISLYHGDSPYSLEKVQDGKVLSIKCKVPGLTAVPKQVTCMGGQWSHPNEAISCIH